MSKGRRVGSKDPYSKDACININKMDKGDSILATFTANELAQLAVLHFERQIKFMSD